MADPKLLTISKEVQTRVQAIRKTAGFHTDIGQSVTRGRKSVIEAGQSFVWLSTNAADDRKGTGILGACGFTVEAHVEIKGDNPEDSALYAIADIHAAVEQPYDPVRQSDKVIGRFEWESDLIEYPEEASNYVSVAVTYTFKTSRKYGEN